VVVGTRAGDFILGGRNVLVVRFGHACCNLIRKLRGSLDEEGGERGGRKVIALGPGNFILYKQNSYR
jgi:hypothetical protein